MEYPTPRIDHFMSDIFNHDSELTNYVRKLYGYALNGHTREELFVLLLGAGGEVQVVCFSRSQHVFQVEKRDDCLASVL
jgi:hypothetical protein